MKKIRPYRFFYIFILLFTTWDQFSKELIIKNIQPGSYFHPDAIPVIKHFFYLVHVHNQGAAWGMFSQYGTALGILAILVLGLIFYFRHILNIKKTYLQISFGLICSGILGNLIDRLRYGYVIDFIDIHIFAYRWPAFNVADSAITIGVAMYIYDSFLKKDLKSVVASDS